MCVLGRAPGSVPSPVVPFAHHHHHHPILCVSSTIISYVFLIRHTGCLFLLVPPNKVHREKAKPGDLRAYSAPWIFFSSRNALWSIHLEACLEVLQLVKVNPKLLSGKKVFLRLLEPKGVFSMFWSSELAYYRLSRFQCVGLNQSFSFLWWDQLHT